MIPPLCRDNVKMFLITTISHYYHHQVATGAVRVVEESLSQSPESKLPISSNTPVDTHPLKLLVHLCWRKLNPQKNICWGPLYIEYFVILTCGKACVMEQ